MLLTIHPDIWTIFKTLIMFILTLWQVKYTFQSSNLIKANTSDTEAAFLDLHLSISYDIVSIKIYDKRDDFDFEIAHYSFLDGDVPRYTFYGVNISQLIRFARASSHVADFNICNKLLTQKFFKQDYRYHKLRKTFSKCIDDTMI